jgi:membrane protease YdiL (CAAX protease family)
MGALGAGWAYWKRGSAFSLSDGGWFGSSSVMLWSLAAAAFAVSVALVTKGLVRRTRWAKSLHMELRATILGMAPERIALLAVLSATAEELLFRSALVPSLGLLASSTVFGLAHFSPGVSKLAWSVWALLMGLTFGVLFLASGSLWPPIVAHALINYENMHYICNYDPTPLDMDREHPQETQRESL